MSIIIILLSIYGFLESVSYGINQYNENKTGAISIFILATIGLILPIVAVIL